jgi:hypothetical protein
LWSTVALGLLLATTGLGRAQDGGKPFAVISLAGYDRINADLGTIGKIVGNPGLAKMLDTLAASATQQKGLVGLDKSRPWGAVFLNETTDYPAYIFLPVTDLKGLLDALQGALGAPAKDTGNGVYEVTTPARPFYAKQKGSWVFVTLSPEGLKNTPADPLPLLGDLTKKYTVAARAFLGNIPPSLREMILSRLKQGAVAANPEGNEGLSLNKQWEKISASLTAAIDDLEEVTLGQAVDASAKRSYLDVTVTAKAGTKLAKLLAEAGNLKTNFAAFRRPEAALALSWVQKTPAETIAEQLAALKAFRDQLPAQLEKKEIAELKPAAEGLLDVVQETVKSGRSDGALSIVLGAKSATLVGATAIVGGDKLDKALHDLAAVAKTKQPELAKGIKLDVEKAAGVRFHVVSLPIPADAENRDKVVEAIGETLDVAIGVADQALYFAAGRDALATLKQTIGKSVVDGPKSATPLNLSIALGPVAKFVAEIGDDQTRPMAVVLSTLLAQSGGKDHVTLVSTAIPPRGLQVRLELEEGIIRVLGMFSQMGGMMGPGGPGGAPGAGF